MSARQQVNERDESETHNVHINLYGQLLSISRDGSRIHLVGNGWKDFVHIEIPGLCIGGGGVSVDSSKQCGHLFLMCNTEGAEKACFKYYQEKILIHGINLQRKTYCNIDIAAGTSIPDKATAVAWCDGDHRLTQSSDW